MISMNKLLIPGVLVATILVAGAFAFIPIDKASTIHLELIAALTGDLGITNQDIVEDLKDKLKLMNATDTETLEIGDDFGPGEVIGFNILVEALDENQENVNFNLKEVYLCGDGGGDTLQVDFIYIENIEFNVPFGFVTDADITIASLSGGAMNINLLSSEGCVDIISALADNGRAGAMGLGSDEELVIEIDGLLDNHIDFVKCIAFTPNAADTLICDIQPFFVGGM